MKIVVGMSGGVDSAVAALLLARAGHEVVGVFMKNWEETDEAGVCAATQDYQDVAACCDVIGIPYYTVNLSQAYWERVFSLFLDEYRKGRTPNPDVLCNREIKFSAFWDFARGLGADRLATGHFVRLGERDGAVSLLRGADPDKDQSYFLYMLAQAPLRQAVFPVGGLTKAQVRQIAGDNRLPVAQKRDSTGICFIGERKFKAFLSRYLPAQPGDIVTPLGRVLGRHDGLMYYTLGQRRGLGIGGGREDGAPCGGNAPDGGRWFVVGKDLAANRLIVQQGADSPLLYSTVCRAADAAWIAGRPPASSFACTAKYRYRQPDQPVFVEVEGDALRITARAPQRAVTPGQSVVLYDGETCLGGGVVDWVEGA